MRDDLLAINIWNLKVAAYDKSGAVINPQTVGGITTTKSPYICDPNATTPNAVPVALEISFRAMSSEAARTVIATQATASVWMTETDAAYQRLIKPNAYEFRTRIKL